MIFLVLAFNLQAQDDFITSPSDTAGMGDMLRVKPEDTQLTPQEEAAASDSLKKAAYLLQRLKNVINIKKDILYGQDVISLVRELQDSSFVLVQPIVSIDAKGVMIGLINQVGSLFEGNNTEPWLKINTKLKPLKDKEMPFSLSAELTGSKQIKADWLAKAKAKMDSVYKGKTYVDVDKATDDITKAYLLALRSLKTSIGKSFTPPFVLKLNNTKYWGGRSIPVWQKKGADSTVMLEAQAPDGSMLSGDIDWGKSKLIVKTNYDQAWINCKNTGSYEITVTLRDSLKQNFTLNVSSSDAKDILASKVKDLLILVCQEIIQGTYDSYAARRDSMMQRKIQAEALPSTTLDEGTAIGDEERFDLEDMTILATGEELDISPEQAKQILASETFQKTANFQKTTQKTANKIILELQLIAIAKEVVKPENFEKFKTEITDNLLANVSKLGISTMNNLINGDDKDFKSVLKTATLELLTSMSQTEFENE